MPAEKIIDSSSKSWIIFSFGSESTNDNQVIVIYSSHNGKNIDFPNRKPIEMYIDDYDLNSIEKFKNDLFEKVSTKSQKKESLSALEIILGIGAAILLIGSLASDNKD